jgi:hypothetical protein
MSPNPVPREFKDVSGAPNLGAAFVGFAPPTSNTTYAPNQYFDVCLPHSSRGVVRLVGFLIRKTLGWCDAEGRPQAEQHVVSYEEFRRAGISRDMIRSAIDEAIAAHFITCVGKPRPNKAGQRAESGLYELKWDERPEYVKDPKRFQGFFAGEGNRSYVPNQWFDLVVPRESLAVLKVVGSVIRFSIGFQNKWGHRRRNVAISYQHIQNYSRLKDRSTLSQAIEHARNANYIERVEEGFFDPNAGRLSRAAVYTVKWLHPAVDESNGRKTRPVETGFPERSENQTGNGQKSRPAERSENQTDIEIKQTNKTFKQQPDFAAAFSKLRGEGFDANAAQAIASAHPMEHIERQIQWLPGRKVKSNRLGMLRAAIEQDWADPDTRSRRQLGRPNLKRPSGTSFAEALSRARRQLDPSNTSTS